MMNAILIIAVVLIIFLMLGSNKKEGFYNHYGYHSGYGPYGYRVWRHPELARAHQGRCHRRHYHHMKGRKCPYHKKYHCPSQCPYSYF